MIIVGIMGGIGHGKTTFAEALRAAEPKTKHIENSELIAEVINGWQSNTPFTPSSTNLSDVQNWLRLLPETLQTVCHQSIDSKAFELNEADMTAHPGLYEKLHIYLDQVSKKPVLMKTPITVTNKSDFRAILQWLGGFVQVKLQPGFWFIELVHRLQRFESEGIVLGILGGVRFPADVEVIKNVGGYVIELKRPLPRELDANDPTELARKKINPDAIIHNDAGISELKLCAKKVYADLLAGNLKPEYFASHVGA